MGAEENNLDSAKRKRFLICFEYIFRIIFSEILKSHIKLYIMSKIFQFFLL